MCLHLLTIFRNVQKPIYVINYANCIYIYIFCVYVCVNLYLRREEEFVSLPSNTRSYTCTLNKPSRLREDIFTVGLGLHSLCFGKKKKKLFLNREVLSRFWPQRACDWMAFSSDAFYVFMRTCNTCRILIYWDLKMSIATLACILQFVTSSKRPSIYRLHTLFIVPPSPFARHLSLSDSGEIGVAIVSDFIMIYTNH